MNYEIDDDLHQRARVAAAQLGITLKAFVEQALKTAVEDHEKAQDNRRWR